MIHDGVGDDENADKGDCEFSMVMVTRMIVLLLIHHVYHQHHRFHQLLHDYHVEVDDNDTDSADSDSGRYIIIRS